MVQKQRSEMTMDERFKEALRSTVVTEPMQTTFQATITLLVQHCLERKRTGEEREALIEFAMKLGEGVDLMHRKWIECQCDLEALQED